MIRGGSAGLPLLQSNTRHVWPFLSDSFKNTNPFEMGSPVILVNYSEKWRGQLYALNEETLLIVEGGEL